MRSILLTLTVLSTSLAVGCGTTRTSDTRRTATEQLLISNAMDQAVSRLDFRAMAGKKIYLDATHLKGVTDQAYLVSSIRQHLLAAGCVLKDTRKTANYIMEARVGVVGTDRHNVLLGIPAINLPSIIPVPGIPTSIPELPLVKKNHQRAVVKIAMFAYNSKTGRPIWQSGTLPVESDIKDVWVLGAGPFQRGTTHKGVNFAGDRLKFPLIDHPAESPNEHLLSIAEEAYFVEPIENLAKATKKTQSKTVKARPKPKPKATSTHTAVQAMYNLAISPPKPTQTIPNPPLAPCPKKENGTANKRE